MEKLTSVDKVITEVRRIAMEKVHVPKNVFETKKIEKISSQKDKK